MTRKGRMIQPNDSAERQVLRAERTVPGPAIHDDGSITKSLGPTDDVVSVFSLVSYVDELKRANEALRQSEASFRTTLESLTDGVIATDVDGRIKYLNPTAERLTGFSASEAVGKAIEQVFPQT